MEWICLSIAGAALFVISLKKVLEPVGYRGLPQVGDACPPMPECKPPAAEVDKLEKFLDEHGDMFKAFSVLNIQPGDTIVLSHPQVMGNHAIENLRTTATEILGPDIKCIVLEEAMAIEGVLRRNYEVKKESE